MLQECCVAELCLATTQADFELKVEKEVLEPLSKLVEEDLPDISRNKKQFDKLFSDFLNASNRAWGSVAPQAKQDRLRDDAEEAKRKLDIIKDQYSADLYWFASKEDDYANYFLRLLELQAEYHRNSHEALQQHISEIQNRELHTVQFNRKVFGEPLLSHLSQSGTEIAVPIHECVQMLLKTGMSEKDLFLQPAADSVVKKLKRSLNGGKVDHSEFSMEPHAVAGVLKCYLRELPEPLMTFDLHKEWFTAAREEELTNKLEQFRVLLKKLPPENYNNLRYLVQFLSLLSEQRSVNRMTPSNIAFVLGPNLLWPLITEETCLSDMASTSVVEPLIRYCSSLFPEEILCHIDNIEEPEPFPEPVHHTVRAVSGGTPSESGSLYRWSPAKVSDWLLKGHRASVATSSGYDTMSEAPTQTDTDAMSVYSVDMSSEEEEVEDSGERYGSYPCTTSLSAFDGWRKMMLIESTDEELKELDLDDSDNDEVYSRSCCEKCKHIQQSYGSEMIVPKKLSRERLQAQLEGEGTYECVFTGLIFEASERVLVCYSVLPWSKFGMFLQSPWMIAGPIFNIEAVDKDPSALKSIQLPHSLCLAGQENEMVFGVLHITGKNPIIDRVQYSGSHLKWSVSSLSPLGVIARDTQQVEHHGAVLVYEDLRISDNSHTFRIYLTLNCSSSHITEIKKKLKKGCFSRVDKNNFCVLVEKLYHLMSEQSAEIHPEDLKFTLASTKYKGYFEAYYELPPPFTFYLKASGTEDTPWSATIREGDLAGSTEKKPSKLQRFLGPLQSGSSKSSMFRKQRSDALDEGTRKRRSLLHQPDMKADFVKKNWSDLIQRVRGVLRVADDLLEKNILTNEIYNEIKVAKTSQDQMRVLLDIICPKGKRAMSAFYDALQKHDWLLVEDLEEDQGR